MKHVFRITLIVSFLLISNYVLSQQTTNTQLDPSLYLFPQFTDGTVTLKESKIWNGKLNYNFYLDQMQFLGPNNTIMTLTEPEKVVSIDIGDHKFINFKNTFIETISNGPVFLYLRIHVVRTTKKIGAYGTTGIDSGISTVSSFTAFASDKQATTDINNLKSNEKTAQHTDLNFYILNSGKIIKTNNQKDLIKCFSSNKDLIQQELERQHTKFNSIESMKKIIDWINANGIRD